MLSVENKTLKILHIEDTEFFRHLFFRALKNVNPLAEYIFYDNCTDAISYLLKGISPPDFIFLDLGMPDMPGTECLMQIKKLNHCQNIPLVILSASVKIEDEKEARKAGANFYLYKCGQISTLCESLTLIFAAKTHNLSSV
jgi:two-component system, response regulator RpfG